MRIDPTFLAIVVAHLGVVEFRQFAHFFDRVWQPHTLSRASVRARLSAAFAALLKSDSTIDTKTFEARNHRITPFEVVWESDHDNLPASWGMVAKTLVTQWRHTTGTENLDFYFPSKAKTFLAKLQATQRSEPFVTRMWNAELYFDRLLADIDASLQLRLASPATEEKACEIRLAVLNDLKTTAIELNKRFEVVDTRDPPFLPTSAAAIETTAAGKHLLLTPMGSRWNSDDELILHLDSIALKSKNWDRLSVYSPRFSKRFWPPYPHGGKPNVR